ncbi:MAG: GNAT family N-acetyltransferase [Halomonas sp.]|nr:GNAT family N-acetyltransferase [Halomonas sp.]MBR2515038.1 GNAT family N-acetyltransferase [Halomonas sp.]
MNATLVECPAAQRREALLYLAAVHDPTLQPGLQEALAEVKETPTFNWQGLWVAQQAGRIEAAVWVQPLANRTAQLWLPKMLDSTGLALIKVACQWVEQQRITLCHTLLAPQQFAWQAPLVAQGMRLLAELEHLRCSSRGRQSPTSLITLVPFSALTSAQQLALVEDVSQDSLDCPALHQLLSIDELLAGFYTKASQAPDHWYQVHYQEACEIGFEKQCVGVLLLAPDPTTPRCELLLMGLLPAWRGRGLGQEIIKHALALAAQMGANELVLTVDASNVPAKRLYERCRFTCYAQQRLLAWHPEERPE